jgi:hypothetical protein
MLHTQPTVPSDDICRTLLTVLQSQVCRYLLITIYICVCVCVCVCQISAFLSVRSTNNHHRNGFNLGKTNLKNLYIFCWFIVAVYYRQLYWTKLQKFPPQQFSLSLCCIQSCSWCPTAGVMGCLGGCGLSTP